MTHYDHATAMAYKLDQWSGSTEPADLKTQQIACQRRVLIRCTVPGLLLRRFFTNIRRCGGHYYAALVSPYQ